jgi:hypothetical protein
MRKCGIRYFGKLRYIYSDSMAMGLPSIRETKHSGHLLYPHHQRAASNYSPAHPHALTGGVKMRMIRQVHHAFANFPPQTLCRHQIATANKVSDYGQVFVCRFSPNDRQYQWLPWALRSAANRSSLRRITSSCGMAARVIQGFLHFGTEPAFSLNTTPTPTHSTTYANCSSASCARQPKTPPSDTT